MVVLHWYRVRGLPLTLRLVSGPGYTVCRSTGYICDSLSCKVIKQFTTT